MMRVAIETERFFLCPNCREHKFVVSHLLPTPGSNPGPWVCDHCGRAWRWKMTEDGLEVSEDEKARAYKQRVVLDVPAGRRVRFVVKAFRYGKPAITGETKEQDRYFYDEHTCPTNWLRDAEVIVDGETDPHGFARYVDTLDGWDEKPKPS